MITTPEQMREAAASDNDLIRRGDVTAIPLLGMTVTQIERAIRAIPIAPQPVAVTVKPLVWREQSNTCQVADTPWGSAAVQDESHALCPHRWGWWMVGSDEDDSATGYGNNIELAKAAAQADYEARILSALTIQPADPLSDPRVVALVEAAKVFMHDVDDLIANSEGVSGLHMNGDVADWESLLPGGSFGSWLFSVDDFRAALRAIGGEA